MYARVTSVLPRDFAFWAKSLRGKNIIKFAVIHKSESELGPFVSFPFVCEACINKNKQTSKPKKRNTHTRKGGYSPIEYPKRTKTAASSPDMLLPHISDKFFCTSGRAERKSRQMVFMSFASFFITL